MISTGCHRSTEKDHPIQPRKKKHPSIEFVKLYKDMEMNHLNLCNFVPPSLFPYKGNLY